MIGNLLGLIERFDPMCQGFLEELGVPYVHMVYEDVVADVPAAVRRVCDLLNVAVDGEMLARINPRTVQQADDLNQQWIERFRATGLR